MGPCQVGKTTLVKQLAKELKENGDLVFFNFEFRYFDLFNPPSV
ncbi:hypothetical protein [Pedobacter ginsengiterrae]